MSRIEIAVDGLLNCAYVRLSEEPVRETVEHDPGVLIDLDEHRCVVGIELLDQASTIPFRDLVDHYHVRSDVVELLRLIRPSVEAFVDLSRGHDGHTDARSSTGTPVVAN
jgi:uncharacterized protein YuzE